MGRMLDALKALEARSPAETAAVPSLEVPPSERMPEPTGPPAKSAAAAAQPTGESADLLSSSINWDKVLDDTTSLVDDAVEMFGLPPLAAEDPLEMAPAPATQRVSEVPLAPQAAALRPVAAPPLLPTRPAARRPTLHAPPFETCTLPLAGEPAECYLEAAARICDQGASNYSNVLLFVSADRGSDACFSMPELARAFALQLAGDVLLIDGDLREGRLSKQVSRPGAGMVEAMLGQAQWPDLIHPTNVAQIDFVARGVGQVPTFERPQFGWSALRPLYRAVVIGPANQAEPETLWLAARCDAVYFVLSRLHTRRSNATAAVNALRAGGANVAGCIVVND